MTHAQQMRMERLREAVTVAYKAFQASNAKVGSREHERLSKKWTDAIKRQEDFADKVY